MTIINYCQKFLIKIIQGYQYVAPYLGIRNCCLFSISCSHYAISAITTKGIFKGTGWTILRLLACQNIITLPWHKAVESCSLSSRQKS